MKTIRTFKDLKAFVAEMDAACVADETPVFAHRHFVTDTHLRSGAQDAAPFMHVCEGSIEIQMQEPGAEI